MAEHTNVAIHIGQLNVRIPGNKADTAHRVAHGIGQSLALKVPTGLQRRLSALSVRVQVPASATEAEMSHAVAQAIIRALKK
jgi:hypothetical protein